LGTYVYIRGRFADAFSEMREKSVAGFVKNSKMWSVERRRRPRSISGTRTSGICDTMMNACVKS